MNNERTIEILEALASGCSPLTGEIINNDSVLNERDVIRALQYAIIELKDGNRVTDVTNDSVNIDKDEVETILNVFLKVGSKPSINKLTSFCLGNRKFRIEEILQHDLYGKYANIYSKGQLIDFFTKYLSGNYSSSQITSIQSPWRDIDFFEKQLFNKLSNPAIKQLKKKISDIEIVKTEGLTEQTREARIKNYRYREPWSQVEIELLEKAINYTNDLNLLSTCFGRSIGSIRTYGKKIIYKKETANAI